MSSGDEMFPAKRNDTTVTHETVLLLLICLADTGHTLFVVRAGVAHEANPLVAWCLDHSDGMFVGFKVGLTLAILAIIENIRPSHDTFIRKCLQLGIIGYSVLYSAGTAILVI
ncbi:MAG TPA: DUF5658 family protein [Fimbriimonas sp.]|nr:DUF5658 family protein [Fimbriimonas sp.]